MQAPIVSGIVVVTGATGNVGRWVVAGLLARGVRVRVAARDPEAARQTFGAEFGATFGAEPEYTRFEFQDETTFPNTFAGATALFLVRPPQLSNVERDIFPALDAAAALGIARVVFLSVQGAERNRVVPHRRIEDHLRANGAAWTFLRPSFFMQNLSTTHRRDIAEHGEVFVPAGAGRTSFVDTRDVGAVAVKVLTEPGHTLQAYELTGREALSYAQVADLFSEVLRRPVRYADPSLWSFWRRMRGYGYPRAYVGVMMALYTVCRLGLAAQVRPELARLLGRAPLSLEQFISDHADCWQPPGAGATTTDPTVTDPVAPGLQSEIL
ncbi:SDR family oxidoreductase [soil metagenome]